MRTWSISHIPAINEIPKDETGELVDDMTGEPATDDAKNFGEFTMEEPEVEDEE